MDSILPFDLHVVILEWVYRLSQSQEVDYSTLAASSLVCKLWTPIAQRLLFRRLRGRISRPQTVHYLINITHHNPSLGTYVRSLSVYVRRGQKGALEVPDFVALLSCFPQMQQVFIDCSDKLTSDELAQVKGLDLQIKCLRGMTASCMFYQLAQAWAATLRYILISGGSPESVLRDTLTPETFSLLGIEFYHLAQPSPVQWLIPSGGDPPLREVELHAYSSLELEALVARAPRLTSLTCDANLPSPHVLAPLQELEELIIHGLPGEAFKLPRSLRHVGFHPWTYAGPTHLEYLFAALSSLPHLSLVSATYGIEPWVLKELGDRCTEMGVDFVVHRNPDFFPRGRYVDWLE
ncbi:hypothetical protein BV25DRAFT_1830045 [Artomyces pyxidatus]|uniref:Uncharacterized protein n=1 Tax=Artomyces pyxidatus TaxID=48021 RepID=A0ACB8SQ81_9AGAM|nr:hypothetical protein BV25DRAFT_1830045 [Artomyces pyxidatus]